MQLKIATNLNSRYRWTWVGMPGLQLISSFTLCLSFLIGKMGIIKMISLRYCKSLIRQSIYHAKHGA